MASDKAVRFVEHLNGLDRGALAALRRSLAFEPGNHVPAFPYVEPFAPGEGWSRTVHYLVAGLFALQPEGAGEGSLGQAVADVYMRRQSASTEARFLALLDADPEQLPHRLRQMIALIKSDGVAVNWAQVFGDLMGWNHESRYVQRKWAREFYRARQPMGIPAVTEE